MVLPFHLVNTRNSIFLTYRVETGNFYWTWSSCFQLDWLASKSQGSLCLHFPSAGFTGVLAHPTFYMGAEDQNSSSHTLTSTTLCQWHHLLDPTSRLIYKKSTLTTFPPTRTGPSITSSATFTGWQTSHCGFNVHSLWLGTLNFFFKYLLVLCLSPFESCLLTYFICL